MYDFKAFYLEERLEKFLEKFNKKYGDDFEYVSGYNTLTDDIVVKCKKCNKEQSVMAHYFTRKEYLYRCECDKGIEINYDDFFEEEIDKLENRDIEYVGYIDTGNSLSNIKVKVRCKKCNYKYIFNYSRIKKGNINCCNGKKNTMNYDTFTNRLLKEMFPQGNEISYKNLLNYEEVIEKEMDYILSSTRAHKFEREPLKQLLLVKAKELKKKYKVGHCSICGELRYGRGTTRLLDEFGDDNICRECYIDYVKCSCCNIEKKRNKFRYIKEDKIFHNVCMKCEENKGD